MKTKRKIVILWRVGYGFEQGHYVYQMKCYENAAESELNSSTVFRTEEEAQKYAEKQDAALQEKGV